MHPSNTCLEFIFSEWRYLFTYLMIQIAHAADLDEIRVLAVSHILINGYQLACVIFASPCFNGPQKKAFEFSCSYLIQIYNKTINLNSNFNH